MDALELIARLGLATTFAAAGLAKLADRNRPEEAIVAFGVSGAIAGPLGIALPFTELAVALLLVPAQTAALGAAGAIVVLLAFSGGMTRSLARGESPDCRCFGAFHSTPVGWSTLVRGLILAAIAAFVLAGSLADLVGNG